MKISHEPAMVSGAVTAALGLLVGYGILDAQRAGLWSALALAVLPLAQGWVTRCLVVPVSKLRGEGRRIPFGDAAPVVTWDPKQRTIDVAGSRDIGERP